MKSTFWVLMCIGNRGKANQRYFSSDKLNNQTIFVIIYLGIIVTKFRRVSTKAYRHSATGDDENKITFGF